MYQGRGHAPVFSYHRESSNLWRFVYNCLRRSRQRWPASTINFSTVKVGTKSSARTVTLTNHLSGALAFTSVVASTGFALASNTCGANIAAGASCTVGVTFSPTAAGQVTGTLTFTDSALTSPQG